MIKHEHTNKDNIASLGGKLRNNSIAIKPVKISTIRYWIDIFSLQNTHLPFNNR